MFGGNGLFPTSTPTGIEMTPTGPLNFVAIATTFLIHSICIDNRGCEYEAYLPDRLAYLEFTLEGKVASDVTDVETAISRLNHTATSLLDTEALALIL